MADIMVKILGQIRDELKTTRTELSSRLDQVSAQIGEMNGQIGETNGRLDQTNQRLDQMKGQVGETNGRLDGLQRRQLETEVRLSTEIVSVVAAIGELKAVIVEDRTLPVRCAITKCASRPSRRRRPADPPAVKRRPRLLRPTAPWTRYRLRFYPPGARPQ